MTRQNFNKQQHQIIIINDGSTDKTEKIASEYVKKYDYFSLVTQENKGVSASRNTGLTLAKGKYVTFVDADDYVSDNIYNPIIELMETNALEGFYFGYTDEEKSLEEFKPEYYVPQKDKSCKMGVWRCIFIKQNIVNNKISFTEEVKYCEDLLFNYKYIATLKTNMAATAQCLYYYRLNKDSATGTFNRSNERLMKDYTNSLKSACIQLKNYTKANNLQEDSLYQRVLSILITSLLWGTMRLKLNAKSIVNALESEGVYLKEIKVKTYAGNSLKYKFKGWLEYNFRHKFIFYLSCFLYKIIGK